MTHFDQSEIGFPCDDFSRVVRQLTQRRIRGGNQIYFLFKHDLLTVTVVQFRAQVAKQASVHRTFFSDSHHADTPDEKKRIGARRQTTRERERACFEMRQSPSG